MLLKAIPIRSSTCFVLNNLFNYLNHSSIDTEIDSSKSTKEDTSVKEDGVKSEKLVIWTTSTYTLTLTSYSTNTATSVQLSYACTVSGMNVAPSC